MLKSVLTLIKMWVSFNHLIQNSYFHISTNFNSISQKSFEVAKRNFLLKLRTGGHFYGKLTYRLRLEVLCILCKRLTTTTLGCSEIEERMSSREGKRGCQKHQEKCPRYFQKESIMRQLFNDFDQQHKMQLFSASPASHQQNFVPLANFSMMLFDSKFGHILNCHKSALWTKIKNTILTYLALFSGRQFWNKAAHFSFLLRLLGIDLILKKISKHLWTLLEEFEQL